MCVKVTCDQDILSPEREVVLIQLLAKWHVKSPGSGLFSDWLADLKSVTSGLE